MKAAGPARDIISNPGFAKAKAGIIKPSKRTIFSILPN
jgi:hypothetical protein